MKVLITGGAGFIGSHLANALAAAGKEVRVLDNHDPQVHAGGAPPLPLADSIEVMHGDVRDPAAVQKALEDVDAVYHMAAAVGVGQSMYEIRRYMDTNSVGTAVLMEALAEHPVDRLVVASSMSIYGEGLYQDEDGATVAAPHRDPQRVRAGDFELRDAHGRALTPIPTPETKTPHLESVYALSKYDQERLALMVGAAHGIPTVALRFFNAYGPGQTLGNPYTGVLAIFATRILNGRSPLVFEDGEQQRDFVHVSDVTEACRLALDAPDAPGNTINVGSGSPIQIGHLAEEILHAMDRGDLSPEITRHARTGDVRHCFADITLAKRLLGYRPKVDIASGLASMREWLEGRTADDRTEDHARELRHRGLLA